MRMTIYSGCLIFIFLIANGCRKPSPEKLNITVRNASESELREVCVIFEKSKCYIGSLGKSVGGGQFFFEYEISTNAVISAKYPDNSVRSSNIDISRTYDMISSGELVFTINPGHQVEVTFKPR